VPLDPSFVGRAYPLAEPYLVSREKLRDFAEAAGMSDPAFHDAAAARALGHPDLVAPPTFPVVVTGNGEFLQDDPELGLDFSRVVHGDQRFVYTRPIYAGERVVCMRRIEEIMSRGGHDFLTIRADITDEAGGHLVTTWTRLVVRGDH
jgi:N-terminal half of MaoC dehydratase